MEDWSGLASEGVLGANDLEVGWTFKDAAGLPGHKIQEFPAQKVSSRSLPKTRVGRDHHREDPSHHGSLSASQSAEANPAQDPGQRPQAASAGAGRCGHVPARWALAPLCRPLYLSRVWL